MAITVSGQKDINDKIIACYNCGETINAITKKFKISNRTFYKILKNNNIPNREILNIDYIINNYKNGASLKEISKNFKISYTKIVSILIKNGINYIKKDKYLKYINTEIKENCFEELNEFSCYWLGLLASDGTIGKNKKSIRLGLNIKDIQLINNFKYFLKANSNIHITKNNLASLTITSKKIVDSCYKYGITYKKSLTLNIKNRELLNSRDFWRGVIDGDGCLIIKKDKKNYCPRISLVSGSYRFIIQYKFFCKRILGKENIKAKIFKDKNTKNPIWRFELNYKNAYNLIDYLYKNNKIALERKEIKAYKILKEFSKQYSKNEE